MFQLGSHRSLPDYSQVTWEFYPILALLLIVAFSCSSLSRIGQQTKDVILIMSAILCLIVARFGFGFSPPVAYGANEGVPTAFATVYALVAFGFGFSFSCLRSANFLVQWLGVPVNFGLASIMITEAVGQFTDNYLFGPLPVAIRWAVVVVWLLWLLILFKIVHYFSELHARPRQNRCQRCGYDLRGTPSNQCPECGAVDSKKM